MVLANPDNRVNYIYGVEYMYVRQEMSNETKSKTSKKTIDELISELERFVDEQGNEPSAINLKAYVNKAIAELGNARYIQRITKPRKTVFCSNCAESFDSNDPRIEMLTDPNGGGTYPVCGSCLETEAEAEA